MGQAGTHNLAKKLENGIFPAESKMFNIETLSGNVIQFGAGLPVDGTSGDTNMVPGSIYIDHTNAKMYINEGTVTTTVWKRIVGAGPSFGFWADCPSELDPDPSRAVFFFDDFLDFAVGDATSKWNLNTTGGTAILGSAEAANTPGAGGYVSIGTIGTTDNDYATIKPCSTDTGAPFMITENSGKKLWWEARIMVSSIVDCAIMAGLFNENIDDCTVNDTGAEAVQDGFYFRTLTASPTEIDTATNQNTTETEIGGNAGTLAAATAITFGMKFDGVTTLTFYINGTALDDVVTIGDTGNIPNDQGLVPGFHIKDGEAAGEIKRLYIDWVKVVQLR